MVLCFWAEGKIIAVGMIIHCVQCQALVWHACDSGAVFASVCVIGGGLRDWWGSARA